LSSGFLIEALGAHDRSTFACGAPPLDQYFRERVSQDVKRLVTSCFIAIEAQTDRIAGYYTLAATGIRASDLPEQVLKRLPRYPILPAALVGRLAVDQNFRGKNLGSALLADAALRVSKSDMKAFTLVVEAKDENALAFYRHFGFRSLASRPMSLFLPVATALRAGQ
jgi:predicted GNAT family N-acyltransferase